MEGDASDDYNSRRFRTGKALVGKRFEGRARRKKEREVRRRERELDRERERERESAEDRTEIRAWNSHRPLFLRFVFSLGSLGSLSRSEMRGQAASDPASG